MKVTPKPCKGITKETKGLGCGIVQFERVHGLGRKCGCYRDWLLNTDVGRAKLKRSELVASKPRLDFEKAEREYNDEKKITALKTNTQMQLHKYIRERDKGKSCISCGVSWRPNFEAGHFYKAETYSGLKFDPDNIHGQCKECNNYNNGNESGYRVGLINRYGKAFVDELDRKAVEYNQSNFKWEIDYLESIKSNINQLKALLK